MYHDELSDKERVSILSLLMFADVKSGSVLKPNGLEALVCFQKDLCEICGETVYSMG